MAAQRISAQAIPSAQLSSRCMHLGTTCPRALVSLAWMTRASWQVAHSGNLL